MIKIPLYPDYETVKNLLLILDGLLVQDFKSMWSSIWGLRGTPQDNVNWKNPDEWIEKRLKGKDKEIALKIWEESDKTINPRWIRGSQFLINGYNLIEEKNGEYGITSEGMMFALTFENELIKSIDLKEGLGQILLQFSIIEKGKRSDLIDDWNKYLESNSNIKKDSVAKDYLRRRVINLVNRGYLDREGNTYSINERGLRYLEFISQGTLSTVVNKETKLNKEVENFVSEQRKNLRAFLEVTKPFQFEHIVKDLLSAMEYEDVEVTSPTNDKGVDVTGISQNGITTVKEVIQVKRNTKSNISRTVLDKLRGSLHRFDAFQGTIITLSDFAKGAKEAALEKGAAPITLINGEKLIDLLIRYKIGIKKKNFDYFLVDESYFNDEDEENLD